MVERLPGSTSARPLPKVRAIVRSARALHTLLFPAPGPLARSLAASLRPLSPSRERLGRVAGALASRARGAGRRWVASDAALPVNAGPKPAVALVAAAVAHGSAAAVILALVLINLLAVPPDPSLVREAVTRAERALGGRYDVSVARAGWTLEGGALGLALHRLDLRSRDEGAGLSVDTAVGRIGLGGGLRSLHLDGVEAAMPAPRPGPIDLAPLQLALGTRLAPMMRALDRLGLDEVRLTGIRSPRAAGKGRQRRLDRPFAYPVDIALARKGEGFAINAGLRVRESVLRLAGTLGAGGDLYVTSEAVPLSEVWSSRTVTTAAPVTATLSAGPASATALDLAFAPGTLRLGREVASLDRARVRTVIDGGRLRVVSAEADIGANRYAFSGSVDAFRTDRGAPAALFTLADDDVTLAPADLGGGPVSLSAVLSGSIDFRAREVAGTIALDGPDIAARGTGRIGLGDHSLDLDLSADRLTASALPAVWPSWIGTGARRWLADHVGTGDLTGVRMAVDLAPGRLRDLGARPLDRRELRVAARMENATTDLFGDLPPLTDAAGSLSYEGTRLRVALDRALTSTASGPVPLAASTFELIDTSDPDLPARFDLALSGDASALGALADAQPIGALAKAGFAPDELTGSASGRLTGTIALKDPERRDWALDLDLDRVALLRALEGREVSEMTGRLGARPDRVRLDATGLLDGVRARFDLVEPIAVPVPDMAPPTAPPERVRRLEMSLDRKALAKLSPGLAELVDGTVNVAVEIEGRGATVSADLAKASIDLPWVGWSKGRGVAATARFAVSPTGDGFRIADLVVDGAGFGARGSAVIDAGGLASLTLDRAALARNDDVRVKVTRKGREAGGGYDIDVRGARVDARGILARLDPRGGKAPDADGGASMPVSLRARIATVRGHGGVEVNGLDVRYRAGRSGLESVAMRAALPGGRQLVVDGSSANGRSDVFATTDDTGTALRFLDLYGRVRGGVLTASFGRQGEGPWIGDVAASDIEIHDEPKLRVMASKVSKRGRIDGSRVRLSRAEIGVVYDRGTLQFTDGIVRGPEVGAAFEGTVIDPAGRVALTGTFLPAYGLNRIFGEVPVLGAFLGNGRDKGLIGITFRLSGETRRPKIEVNPLSAMAPGIFRRVFEYR